MSSRESLVQKLKDGIQDAVIFLRYLEQIKIPAVVDRRRKNLLDKLLELQGDTRRDAPPKFEVEAEEDASKKEVEANPDAKVPLRASLKKEDKVEAKPDAKVPLRASPKKEAKVEVKPDAKVPLRASLKKEAKVEAKPETGADAPPVLIKRDSQSVFGRVKELEQLAAAAKSEEKVYEDFKRKVISPEEGAKDGSTDGGKQDESTDGGKKAGEETPSNSSPSVMLRGKKDDLLKPERPSSVASTESLEEDKEDVVKEKKGKSKGLKGLFGKKKKPDRSRDPSPAPLQAQTSEEVDEPKPAQEDKDIPPDFTLQAQLEKRVKKFGGHGWVKQTVTLKENVLIVMGEKNKEDKIELVGCTCAPNDAANMFDLHQPDHKQLTFRAETTEVRDQWVMALQEAIQECTPAVAEAQEPAQEEEGAEVPKITVEAAPETQTPTTEEKNSPDQGKGRKESKASKVAPKKTKCEIPDQGVQMKGYAHRKVGWNKWEKCWCILTYNALYFTNVEDNKDYSAMFPISSEAKNSVQQKKGQGSSQGLLIKSGNKKEQISVESSSQLTDWRAFLEQVMGIGGVEELASEDEEIEEEIEEELYEEVDRPDFFPPPVPSSPRPPHKNLIPDADDIQDMGGEDIYEEFDDPLPPPQPTKPPALPQRNEAPPTLPARKEPAPALPPRHPTSTPKPITRGKPQPQEYEVTSSVTSSITSNPPPRPPPPADNVDDELYDDVVQPLGNEIEETYDDVIISKDEEIEETYDDVVTGPPTTEDGPGELYEDMAPGVDEPQGEYVIMEHGEGGDEEGELYDEVDESPRHINTGMKQKSEKEKSGTFSQMFRKSKQPSAKGTISGQLSYKAPGKGKFKEQWFVVEGNTLQIFKSATDKKPHEKVSINESDLSIGSTEAGAGTFAFRLTTKGAKTFHFSAKTKDELDSWIGVLKGMSKSASLDLGRDEPNIYQAKEDHIADSDEQLTFKKGSYIRLISMHNEDVWIGQLGNEAQEFNGKIGKFPVSKVEIAEDLYI